MTNGWPDASWHLYISPNWSVLRWRSRYQRLLIRDDITCGIEGLKNDKIVVGVQVVQWMKATEHFSSFIYDYLGLL